MFNEQIATGDDFKSIGVASGVCQRHGVNGLAAAPGARRRRVHRNEHAPRLDMQQSLPSMTLLKGLNSIQPALGQRDQQ